jgi:hypothetical protein
VVSAACGSIEPLHTTAASRPLPPALLTLKHFTRAGIMHMTLCTGLPPIDPSVHL